MLKYFEGLSDEKNHRYTLGTEGTNPLIVFGLNPSTASNTKSDLTITKVKGFAKENGFDSFIMLNLYPLRTPYPTELPDRHDKALYTINQNLIETILKEKKVNSILAAWGETIKVRPYFKECLNDILCITNKLDVQWMKIGETKSGHPRHPSRAPYGKLASFDIAKYLDTLK